MSLSAPLARASSRHWSLRASPPRWPSLPMGRAPMWSAPTATGHPRETVLAINTETDGVIPISVGAGDTMGVAVGRL